MPEHTFSLIHAHKNSKRYTAFIQNENEKDKLHFAYANIIVPFYEVARKTERWKYVGILVTLVCIF